MTNYVKSTNFATKDNLASGDPLKIVKGTEINTEYDNIAIAVATKADVASPTFTGTVTIPTLALTNDLPVTEGGTGASTATDARTNLSAAKSGANSDITSITGLTTALAPSQGGTGLATLTANNVVLGNGTSAVQFVAPSTAGNLLTSNGTTWTSTAPAASGVTSVATGNGLTGGTITSSGTLSLDYYTGTDRDNTSYPIGTYLFVAYTPNVGVGVRNASSTIYGYTGGLNNAFYVFGNFAPAGGLTGFTLSGTWRARGAGSIGSPLGLGDEAPFLIQRTA
jgi:hypothetical protein